jgi:hypothetical protein
MRSLTMESVPADRDAFYARSAANSQPEEWNEFARDAPANNRPGAVMGRIILAVVAFALLSAAVQVAIKLAHIA